MDAIAQLLGLTAQELTQLLIMAGVLVVGLVVLRVFLKLTATLFRFGCLGILLLLLAIYVLGQLR